MTKLKKVFLRIAIILGAAFLLLVFAVSVYSWKLDKEVEAKVAAIKAAGDPTCLADLARKPIPTEQNGATYLIQASAEIEKLLAAVETDKDGNYHEPTLKQIENELQHYPNIRPLLEKVVACPKFDFQQDIGNLPSKICINNSGKDSLFEVTHRSWRYLNHETTVAQAAGRNDELLRSAILLFRLGRQISCDPFQTHSTHIVALSLQSESLKNAYDVLQRGSANAQLLDELNAELAECDYVKECRRSTAIERAYWLDLIREMPQNHIFLMKMQLAALKTFENYLHYCTEPCSEWITHVPQADLGTVNLTNLDESLNLGLRSMLICSRCTQARKNALRIINALQSKNITEDKKIPTMAELGLPDEVGVDPFNGKSMQIKKQPKGWLVYSVGENLKDDGGELETPLDVGFGPKK